MVASSFEEDPELTYNSDHMRMYYAFLPGGESVATRMVSAGMASASGEGQETEQLQALEGEARAANIGCLND